MARVRRLILAVEVRPAGKLSKCKHDSRHKIPRGDLRFVITDSGGMREKGYCGTCGKTMIAAARKHLDELESILTQEVEQPNSAIS